MIITILITPTDPLSSQKYTIVRSKYCTGQSSSQELLRNIPAGMEPLPLLCRCNATQQKTPNLFWPDENGIEQCFAAHIVQGCQQH